MNKFILEKILGWKIIGDTSPYRRNCITLVIPHTSYWDGFLGYFAMKSLGINFITMSAEWLFFWPFSLVMKNFLHAFPVGKKSGNMFKRAKTLWKDQKNLNLVMCPEGHLRKVTKWPRGFWNISKRFGIPVNIAAFNYKDKAIYLLGELKIDDDPDQTLENLEEISRFYIYPKHLNDFSFNVRQKS